MGYKDIQPGGVLEYIKTTFLGKLVKESRSPAGNWLGFTLTHIEKGRSIIELEVRSEMTNPYGNIHGGMMSLIIDESIGWAVVSLDASQNYTSLTLNVDFLFAIKGGERLRAESVVLRVGKKIVNVECHVFDMENRILARANSNLIATGMEFTH